MLWTVFFKNFKAIIEALFLAFRSMGDSFLNATLVALHSYFPDSTIINNAGTTLAQINYFFPLSEVYAMAVILGAMWSAVFVYRAVKSWIPTVAS